METLNPPDASEGQGPRLKIHYRRIDELKPDRRNPRDHSRKQIKQLASAPTLTLASRAGRRR
jgi:hypothetical protein